MPQTLTFDLSFAEEDRGAILVKAVPRVDGVVLDSRGKYAFDLCLLLAIRHTTEWPSPWLFNCQCGTPSCAHIEDPTELEVGAERVTWVIPESLRPELSPVHHGEGPLRFEFAKNQYFAELNRVIAAIDVESERRGRRVQISLWNENLAGEGLSAEQELVERLKRWLHMDRWLTWREHVWHDFDQVDLEMDLTNGYVLGISLESLANCLAGMTDRPVQWTEELGHEIEVNIAPSLKSGLDAVAERARTLDWPTLVACALQADRSPVEVEFGEFEHQRDWPLVEFSLSTHAQRYPRFEALLAEAPDDDTCVDTALSKAVKSQGGRWDSAFSDLADILRNPSQQQYWFQAIRAIARAADAGVDVSYFDSYTIAQMYRNLDLLPNLGRSEPDEGINMVWALSCKFKGVGPDSVWRPLEDPEVASQLARLRAD